MPPVTPSRMRCPCSSPTAISLPVRPGLAYPMGRSGPARCARAPPHAAAMHIRDWPEGERPREKLLALGPGRLSDAELLAVFLGSGTRGLTAVDLGRRLLDSSGNLRALL